MVEKEGFAFLVGIEYEKLPLFCSHCMIIGHSLMNCNKIKKKIMPRYVPKVKETDRENNVENKTIKVEDNP